MPSAHTGPAAPRATCRLRAPRPSSTGSLSTLWLPTSCVRTGYLAQVEAGFTRPQAMQPVYAKLCPGKMQAASDCRSRENRNPVVVKAPAVA